MVLIQIHTFNYCHARVVQEYYLTLDTSCKLQCIVILLPQTDLCKIHNNEKPYTVCYTICHVEFAVPCI
jgi:hypothetical protein